MSAPCQICPARDGTVRTNDRSFSVTWLLLSIAMAARLAQAGSAVLLLERSASGTNACNMKDIPASHQTHVRGGGGGGAGGAAMFTPLWYHAGL